MEIFEIASWSVFITNFLLGGWMVSVDAAIFLTFAIAFVEVNRRLGVVIMITLAHAAYGFIGLGLVAGGQTITSALAIGTWLVVFTTSFLGLRFITDGLDEGGEEDDHELSGSTLNRNLWSAAAFSLYSAVSIDELFSVMQKFQWMTTQHWSYAVMALNIAASMMVLFGLLWLTWQLIEHSPRFVTWLKQHGDRGMFIVFSLIMYYLVRGVVQNGLGYQPWEIPLTGIAPELLPLGFMLTWLLQWALKNKKFKIVAKTILRLM